MLTPPALGANPPQTACAVYIRYLLGLLRNRCLSRRRPPDPANTINIPTKVGYATLTEMGLQRAWEQDRSTLPKAQAEVEARSTSLDHHPLLWLN